MFVWGINIVIIKVLVGHFPPLTMTSTRVFLAGIIVFLILIFQRSLRTIKKKEWLYLIAATLLGVTTHHGLLTLGIVQTKASNASLILGLVPLTTSILAMIFLHDRFTVWRFTGIIFGLAGVSFVVLQGEGGLGSVALGDVYVFGAMLVQAISFIVIKKVTDTLDAKQVTAVMMMLGSILLYSLSLWTEPGGVKQLAEGTLWLWFLLLFSALVGTGLGHMLYNLAIHQLGPAQTSIFTNLVPFFALLGSFLFLGESIHLSQMIGFVFIVAGVFLGTGYLDNRLGMFITHHKSYDQEDEADHDSAS